MYSKFHICRGDGCEIEYRELFGRIIERNDGATLNRYIEKNLRGALAPDVVYYHDPFFVAAQNGSTDALRVLLQHYHADPTQTQPLDQRGFRLLNVACRYAQLETVRFLLDSRPSLEPVHASDRGDETTLLSAAESLAYKF